MIDLWEKSPRFPVGQVVATPAVLELGADLNALLDRHVRGDWGDVDEEDWNRNESALEEGSRLFSVYALEVGTIWIITEADRSSTCVLLPSDY